MHKKLLENLNCKYIYVYLQTHAVEKRYNKIFLTEYFVKFDYFMQIKCHF